MISSMSAEHTGPASQETAKHLLLGSEAPKRSKHKAKVQCAWSCLVLEEVHLSFVLFSEREQTH